MSARKTTSVIAIAFAAGCANYATLQEADTMPQGHGKFGIGATGTSYKVEAGDTVDSVTVPALNLWYRRGLAAKLEGHASVWMPLGASVGAKYQLTGARDAAGLSLSLGLDLGFLQLTSEDEMGTEFKQTVLDTYVPLYIGYRSGPSFALYTSPKYILRTSTGDAGTAFSHLAGGTLGLAVGAKTQFLLEGTVVYDTLLKEPAFQGGVGVAF